MLNQFALECVICSIVVVYCGGKPLGRISKVFSSISTNNTSPKDSTKSIATNLIDSKNNTSPQIQVLQNLFGLLNKTVVQTLVIDHNNITRGSLSTDKLQQLLSLAKLQPTSTSLENRFQEISSSSLQPPRVSTRPSVNAFTNSQFPSAFSPPGPSHTGYFSNGKPSQITLHGKPVSANLSSNQPLLQSRGQENITGIKPPLDSQKSQSLESTTSSKTPLEYKPQRPFFAGQTAGGRPGQLIPLGEPLPAGNEQQIVQDRFPEISTISAITTNKSPLDYNPQRPFFAGQTAGGRPGQLIPPGESLPAGNEQQIVQDRFPEISTRPSITNSKPPLEYNPQRPFFASQFAGGRPGQLIPPGKPLPADNDQQNTLPNNSSLQSLEDRFQAPVTTSNQSETNLPTTATPISTSSITTILPLTTYTKSPLEYNNQRPSYASQASSGRPGQLIPPGKPWPADPPTVQNRFPDIPYQPEGDGQRPSFSGQFSNGSPGQLIPHGNPWPADASGTKPLDQDKFLGYTSSVQYKPDSDSLERQFANVGPDRLMPPRGSWPTNPLEVFDYAYF